MSTGVWVALIASMSSLVVAAGSARAQRKTAREAREEQRRSDAKVVLDKYRGPLLAAAADLGRRINNIRHDQFLAYVEAGSARAGQARLTTLFRFAQYFGWREILRTEAQLLRFEREADTGFVAALIGDIDWTFASDQLDEGGRGMLWAEEQRGIGELMKSRNEDGSCTSRGYATFASEYDERFAPWMDRLEAHVLCEEALSSQRLRLLQWALLGLVMRLDEEQALTNEKWMDRAREELREDPAPHSPRIERRIRAHAQGQLWTES